MTLVHPAPQPTTPQLDGPGVSVFVHRATIFNQDRAPMPNNAAFNVTILSEDEDAQIPEPPPAEPPSASPQQYTAGSVIGPQESSKNGAVSDG